MSSTLMKGLKRTTCAILCYGMVFSYPSWTIFGRVAHASTPDSKQGGVGGVADPDLQVDTKPEPGTAASKEKPAPTVGGEKKHDAKETATGDDKKKGGEPPVGASCADDKFFLGATSGGSMNIFTGDAVCAQGTTNTVIQPHCWTQFFTFLGGAEANSYYVNGAPDRSPAPAVAARTLATVKDFVPKVGDELSKTGNEEALTKVLDNLSRPDVIKDGDNKQCCLQLVDQARKVANYINTASENPSRRDLKPNKAQQDKMQALIAEKQQKCESGGGGAVVVAGHDAPPPPPQKEKKKNGMLWAVLIAIGVGLLIWALTRKKSKKKKARPTERPPVCKGKKCGGGGGGNGEERPPCSTGNCGNNVGTTTAEEPAVTNGGNTYAETNGGTRGNSTGESGGDTYADTNGGGTRGNSTGDVGTVTGSTTATNGDDTGGSVSGGDDPVSGGNNPGRTTSGQNRLAPDRTLIKK